LKASLRVNVVIGKKGSRQIATAEGPAVADYSEVDQPGDDPVAANAGGWNCRTHREYEGKPAVDWYVPEGQPVYATLDGEATLYIVTTVNAFDFYGVEREPYYGDPDRARAPLDPFAGRPGGGKGVFVHVENERYIANYGHLSLARTLEAAPPDAFIAPYGPSYDYAAVFGTPRRFDEFDAIARWEVRAGEVIGYTGDTGYSEAPHLHYEIAALGPEPVWLCPTREEGFGDGGWLFR
jgi:murein DD-endopeptidase MepM/ murein hydrolase activator NlpD